MSKTRKTIADSLKEATSAPVSAPVIENPAETPPKKAPAASKTKATAPKPAFQRGKKGMTLYYAPQVSKQLKQIALDEDRTLHDVMKEAINDFFTKKRKPPIA